MSIVVLFNMAEQPSVQAGESESCQLTSDVETSLISTGPDQQS